MTTSRIIANFDIDSTAPSNLLHKLAHDFLCNMFINDELSPRSLEIAGNIYIYKGDVELDDLEREPAIAEVTVADDVRILMGYYGPFDTMRWKTKKSTQRIVLSYTDGKSQNLAPFNCVTNTMWPEFDYIWGDFYKQDGIINVLVPRDVANLDRVVQDERVRNAVADIEKLKREIAASKDKLAAATKSGDALSVRVQTYHIKWLERNFDTAREKLRSTVVQLHTRIVKAKPAQVGQKRIDAIVQLPPRRFGNAPIVSLPPIRSLHT